MKLIKEKMLHFAINLLLTVVFIGIVMRIVWLIA
jgi:hypothetical protein